MDTQEWGGMKGTDRYIGVCRNERYRWWDKVQCTPGLAMCQGSSHWATSQVDYMAKERCTHPVGSVMPLNRSPASVLS